MNITQQLLDSIPEKNVVLTFAPGFGGGGSNAAFVSMGLVNASERKRSQDEIAQQMTRMFRRYNNLRVFATAGANYFCRSWWSWCFSSTICSSESEF